jgi:hypothetical protein
MMLELGMRLAFDKKARPPQKARHRSCPDDQLRFMADAVQRKQLTEC